MRWATEPRHLCRKPELLCNGGLDQPAAAPPLGIDMPARLALLLLPIALLTACASSGAVKQLDKDRYQVSYNAGMKPMTWVEIKNVARQQAENHCASMGLQYARPEVTSNKATGLLPKEAIITFSCDEPKAVPPKKG
ncbi:hypothetical protein CAL27_20830 [Bordetella genomosp. 1]|uniref:Lipoprotein n=2 Tax=Bordetella genomosp. 1 TaxID=1395607 RepID=A0ABX4EUG2_9BORD|nr:hypothetical protein CAL27_20830 [Bordetella genomosp. 1]